MLPRLSRFGFGRLLVGRRGCRFVVGGSFEWDVDGWVVCDLMDGLTVGWMVGVVSVVMVVLLWMDGRMNSGRTDLRLHGGRDPPLHDLALCHQRGMQFPSYAPSLSPTPPIPLSILEADGLIYCCSASLLFVRYVCAEERDRAVQEDRLEAWGAGLRLSGRLRYSLPVARIQTSFLSTCLRVCRAVPCNSTSALDPLEAINFPSSLFRGLLFSFLFDPLRSVVRASLIPPPQPSSSSRFVLVFVR